MSVHKEGKNQTSTQQYRNMFQLTGIVLTDNEMTALKQLHAEWIDVGLQSDSSWQPRTTALQIQLIHSGPRAYTFRLLSFDAVSGNSSVSTAARNFPVIKEPKKPVTAVL